MPFEVTTDDLGDKRVFSVIDDLGSTEVPIEEKIVDIPDLLEWYKYAGFSDSQVEEINNLRSTYRPLASLMMNEDTFNSKWYYDGKIKNDENLFWYEGRGIYHVIGKIVLYLKGIGDRGKARKTNHNYSGFPDEPIYSNYMGAGETERPVGTVPLMEAEMEAVNGIVLLKRMMDLHSINTINDAIREGFTVPLVVSKYPELSKQLHKMAIGTEHEKDIKVEYGSILSIVESPYRLESFRPRYPRGPKEEELRNIPAIWEKFESNRLSVWRGVGTRLREMLRCGMWLDPNAFHSQNIHVNVDSPWLAYPTDAVSYFDISELDEYLAIHYIAYSLNRSDGIIPVISPYNSDNLSKDEFREYMLGLCPEITNEKVLKIFPAVRMVFKPILSFAVAELLMRGFDEQKEVYGSSYRKIMPEVMYQEYQNYLNNLNSGVQDGLDRINLERNSPWLNKNYKYIEMFVEWLRTGDESSLLSDPEVGKLFEYCSNGTVEKIEQKSISMGDKFDLTQEGVGYGIAGVAHRYFSIIPQITEKVTKLASSV